MKTQAIVVADDPVYLSWLQNAVSGAEFSLIRPLDADDLVQRLQMLGRADLIFFQFTSATAAERAEMVERLLDRMPDLPIVGLGEDGDPQLVLSAMRAGARDFFVLQRDDANVAALMGKLLRRSSAVTQAGRRQGKLFALLSGHPYEGTAFLGQHLALACAEKLAMGERTILVDVAMPAGAAAIFLNINQTYGVLDAVNDANRCDQTLVETAFAKHSSGLYLLSLPEDLIGRPNLDVVEFLKLLQVLRGLFACVVVTLDGHFPLEGVRGVVAQADRALMITDQSILKSRHSKYLLRALRLEDTPLDRAGLVVDNYRHRLGLEPENLAELLDLPLVATLSSQGSNRILAMNSGESLFTLAPKDPYCIDVRRIADALLSGELAKALPAKPGLLGRLFS